jgi:Zn-dependent protease
MSIALMALAVIIVSILVHELGHAFVARRMGLGPVRIVLHGFGGLTHFSKRPDNRQGVIVSLAGPVAGMALGILSWLIAGAILGPQSHFLTVLGFQLLIWINIFWSFFNLLPMYPLDGGQVLWHALALKMPPGRARRITKQISMATSVGVGVYALISGYLFVALICLFTYSQNAKNPT